MLGDALEFETTIDDGRHPSTWAISFFNSKDYGAATFNPVLDSHLGVFYSDDVLYELLRSAKTPRGRSVKSFVSLRFMDCGEEPLLEDVPQNNTLFYERALGEHLQVMGFLRQVVDAIRGECRKYGFAQPPARGWDLVIMAITSRQAEELATICREDLEYVLHQGAVFHVPIMFLVTGDPRLCPSFMSMLDKALFFGRPNMAYIREAMGGVGVLPQPEQYLPIGYEPRLDYKTQKYVLNTLYTHVRKSKVADVRETVEHHNKAAYNDFLAMLG